MLFFHNTPQKLYNFTNSIFYDITLKDFNLHPKPTTGGQVRDSLAFPPIERGEGKKWLTSLQTIIFPL